MKLNFEVWAQLFLSDEDCERLRKFFVEDVGIKPRFLLKRLHMTVYHARRPFPDLINLEERANIVVAAADTRFMVMAPGGENPRPEINPAQRKIGIRVQRQSVAMAEIQALRKRLIDLETPKILGNRRKSTEWINAFGSRHFQPHVGLIRAGSGVSRDLSLLGIPFREKVRSLHFDRFLIERICFKSNNEEASAAGDNPGRENDK